MNLDNINKRNSREWIRVNKDSQAPRYREAIVQKYGGRFYKRGNDWNWTDQKLVEEIIPTLSIRPKTKWIFIHPDGKEELVENLSKFCRKHELNKAAMYEVYNGKRNHHKNFKLKKQGD